MWTKGLWILVAAIVLLLTLPAVARAQEGQFILHPAYIDGTITIQDGLGGNIPIKQLSVSASGTDPVTNTSYSASTSAANTNQFHLVVEGGAWPYSVNISAAYGNYPYFYVRWQRRVSVSPNQTVQLNLFTDAFITGTVSVAGETVTYLQPSASVQNVDVSSPQYGFQSSGYFTNGQYRLPVLSGNGTYRVNSGSPRLTDGVDSMSLG